MFFKKSNKIQNSIDTLVGADTSVEGDIHFSGGLRVDGTIKGNVSEPNASPSTLILSEYGRIEGTVSAAKIVVNGKIVG
ncbi:MAG: cell shape determination protein CcmA, partial [Betaproteobacteria bacterium HGW-Betaproteobacteria-20]